MAAGTEYVRVGGDGPVPQDYNVAGTQTFDLLGVKADFDGSAALADFVPVVQILSPANQVMAESIGDTVTAGDSATVTFAPFLNRGGVSTARGFIRFDFLNQGGALDIRTADSSYSTTGFLLSDASTLGIVVRQDANGPILVNATGNGGLTVRSDGDGDLLIQQTGNALLRLENDGNGGTLIDDNGSSGLRLTASQAPMVLDVTGPNLLFVLGLPNADPGMSGALWNNAGVVNISP